MLKTTVNDKLEVQSEELKDLKSVVNNVSIHILFQVWFLYNMPLFVHQERPGHAHVQCVYILHLIFSRCSRQSVV